MQKRFPELERDLQNFTINYLGKVGSFFAPLSDQVPVQRLFEGDQMSTIREQGTYEENEIREFSTDLVIPTNTILYASLDEVLKLFEPIGKKIAFDKERMLLDTVSDAAEKVGNVVSAEGKPFSVAKLFEMLETVQIDFDQQGLPKMPTLVAGREIIEQFEALQTKPEDPELEKAFNDLIQRKKAEWLAREADRTLVG